DGVFDEVGALQIGEGHGPGAGELVAQGRKNGIGGRGGGLGGKQQGGGSGGSDEHGGRDEKPAAHWPPRRVFSMVVGSGRSGGRSLALAFFSISISETRMAGATAETGTDPDSAPQ